MTRTWHTRRLTSSDAATCPVGTPQGYLGEDGLAISADGTKVIAGSCFWGWRGRAYVWEKSGDVWTQTGELDPTPNLSWWYDAFDGDLTKEKLSLDGGSGGSAVEAGGRLTISATSGALSTWLNCPVAWRYDLVGVEAHWLYTTISAMTTEEGAQAGLCIYPNYLDPADRAVAALLAVEYSAGVWGIQHYAVEASVLTAVGARVTISDPNVTPVELQFIYDIYWGWGTWWYRQGSSEWVIGSNEIEWTNMALYAGCRTGLFVACSGSAAPVVVSFDELRSRPQAINDLPGAVAIEGDTAVVGRRQINTETRLLDDFAAPVPAAGDEFGYALAAGFKLATIAVGLNDCFVAAGAPGTAASAGTVHIFNWDKYEHWNIAQTLVGSDTVAGDRFGAALAFPYLAGSWVAHSVDVLFVGAPDASVGGLAGAGAVYVFERPVGGVWTQTAKLTAPIPSAGGAFGFSVSSIYSSGTYDRLVLIGNPGANADQGAVHCMCRATATGVWTVYWSHTPADVVAGDRYGQALAYVGGSYPRVYVGAPQHNLAAGAVYRLSTTTGAQLAKIVAPDAIAGDLFGYSVAYDSRDPVIIGAPARAGNTGAVYVFSYAANAHVRTICPDYAVAGDRFGVSLALAYDRLIVGADGNGAQAGYAVLYHSGYAVESAWTDLGKHAPDVPEAAEKYGAAVVAVDRKFFATAPAAAAGGRVLAWCPGEETEGQGYYPSTLDVYKKVAGVWEYSQTIHCPRQWVNERIGLDIAISEDESTIAASTYPWGGSFYGVYAAFVFKDAGSGFEFSEAFLPDVPVWPDLNSQVIEINHAYPEVKLSADGNTLIIEGNTNVRAWSEPATSVSGLSSSIPNPACSIVKSTYSLDIKADASTNPADWNGGGVYSCPIGYATPVPLAIYGRQEAAFQARLYEIVTTDPANAFAGVAFYDDPASDAYIIEYNRTTKKCCVWLTSAGGVKALLHESTELLDLGATSSYLRMYFYYNPDENRVTITQFYINSTYKDLTEFSYVLPFTPTKFGAFCRIADPAVSVATAQFGSLWATTRYNGRAHVYGYSGGVWTQTQAISPWEELSVAKGALMYVDMSHSGEWLVFTVTGGALDIYRDTGAGFVFFQRILLAELPFTATGFNTVAIADGPIGGVPTLTFNAYGAGEDSVVFYLLEGGAFVYDSLVDTSDLGYSAGILRLASDGFTLVLNNPYEEYYGFDAGDVVLLENVPPYPLKLPAAGLFIDEVREL